MISLLKEWLLRLFLFLFNTEEYLEYGKIKEKATNATQFRQVAELQSLKYEGWKCDNESTDYDYRLIYDRHQSLYAARKSGDIANIMFLLRTSLNRHIGDIHNPVLYEKCYGTKHLINAYINEVMNCLDFIILMPSIPHSVKQEFVYNCRNAYGRTALLLSGGGALNLHHIGVIKSLYEHHCLPRIMSGSSGGAIVAAYIAIHTDSEFQEMMTTGRFYLNLFEPVHTSWFIKLRRLFKTGFLFKADEFVNALRRNYNELTFLEAYNRTGRILNITVTSNSSFEMQSILNFATAPNVMIWSAVACSCAVPGILSSFTLMAKDKNGKQEPWINGSSNTFIDGSFDNDLPMKRVSEMFNVNQFIVCQVNPHILPFLSRTMRKSRFRILCENLTNLIFKEVELRFMQINEFVPIPFIFVKLFCILDQRYTGDVTICPKITIADYLRVIRNPLPE